MVVFSSPILSPPTNEDIRSRSLYPDCYLPSDLTPTQGIKFLEDCDSLNRFTVPVTNRVYALGVHPKVCCPNYVSEPEYAIVFPDDPCHPDYLDTYGYDECHASKDELEDDPGANGGDVDTMNDDICREDSSSCVSIDQCLDYLHDPRAPENQTQAVCGFDQEAKLLKICCPKSFLKKTEGYSPQKPRFPKNGKARKVSDKTKMCGTWAKNNACKLDRHFYSEMPYMVRSQDMFDFMTKACLETCGWAPGGCYDEHPRCQEWAKNGYCSQLGVFMAHTCRESCGVCGFLSSTNEEEQKSDGVSYTDYTRSDFDCGRFKLLKDLNQQDDNSVDTKTSGSNLCGSTRINDRWVLSAAHCFEKFEPNPDEHRTMTVRENTASPETVEVKRVYTYPHRENLYDDIAVVELGRRIHENYELYGDSPVCLPQPGDNFFGKIAKVTGFGFTENRTSGDLLETNVTVITKDECVSQYKYNISIKDEGSQAGIQEKLCNENGIPDGLNDRFICSKGIFGGDRLNAIGETVISGSCPGDSGGPLTVPDENGRSTLVGVVSGGIGCGDGFPSWYTRVSFYKDWISCIIEKSLQFDNNQKKVEDVCSRKTFRRSINDKDRIVGKCK